MDSTFSSLATPAVGMAIAGTLQSSYFSLENRKRDEKFHQEEIEFTKNAQYEEIKEVRRTYIMSAFNDMERHFQQLNSDLIEGSKESEKDMVDQRSLWCQTIILASTIMILALIAVLIQAEIPYVGETDNNKVNTSLQHHYRELGGLYMAYAISNAASLSCLFLAVVIYVEIVYRIAKFNIQRASEHGKILKKAMKETQGLLKELKPLSPRQQHTVYKNTSSSSLLLQSKEHNDFFPSHVVHSFSMRNKYPPSPPPVTTNVTTASASTVPIPQQKSKLTRSHYSNYSSNSSNTSSENDLITLNLPTDHLASTYTSNINMNNNTTTTTTTNNNTTTTTRRRPQYKTTKFTLNTTLENTYRKSGSPRDGSKEDRDKLVNLDIIQHQLRSSREIMPSSTNNSNGILGTHPVSENNNNSNNSNSNNPRSRMKFQRMMSDYFPPTHLPTMLRMNPKKNDNIINTDDDDNDNTYIHNNNRNKDINNRNNDINNSYDNNGYCDESDDDDNEECKEGSHPITTTATTTTTTTTTTTSGMVPHTNMNRIYHEDETKDAGIQHDSTNTTLHSILHDKDKELMKLSGHSRPPGLLVPSSSSSSSTAISRHINESIQYNKNKNIPQQSHVSKQHHYNNNHTNSNNNNNNNNNNKGYNSSERLTHHYHHTHTHTQPHTCINKKHHNHKDDYYTNNTLIKRDMSDCNESIPSETSSSTSEVTNSSSHYSSSHPIPIPLQLPQVSQPLSSHTIPCISQVPNRIGRMSSQPPPIHNSIHNEQQCSSNSSSSSLSNSYHKLPYINSLSFSSLFNRQKDSHTDKYCHTDTNTNPHHNTSNSSSSSSSNTTFQRKKGLKFNRPPPKILTRNESSRRHVAQLASNEIDEEYKNHEISVLAYFMKQRDDVNTETAAIFQKDRSFEYYWNENCKYLDQYGVFLFYMGTVLMAVAVMVYMWANFKIRFYTLISSIIAIVIISSFLFVSVFVRVIFKYIDNYVDEDKPSPYIDIEIH